MPPAVSTGTSSAVSTPAPSPDISVTGTGKVARLAGEKPGGGGWIAPVISCDIGQVLSVITVNY